ncbi:hypothetical protein H6P81_017981 [Aristolochia fimbriata]|uniref:Uncharacterized protein n=1 Tax=Aristolochia fimbriata TaxID=158543 RepID=A0AAV7E2S8_ARIFI|nr:hypothetical protein H6P81_017981 [Aristolochia fimbriata]
MEPPECPVCLQPYDADETIPRVLSCGHSVCESCLTHIPHQFPNTIRCPACTQLVPLARPATLPRNIDLLRLIHDHPKSKPKTTNPQNAMATKDFAPRRWCPELYSAWKDHILPSEAVEMMGRSGDEDWTSLSYGSLNFAYSYEFRPSQQVSLLPVAKSPVDESEFSLSYISRVMDSLHLMKKKLREELQLLFQAAFRQPKLCKVYGLWMNLADGLVFLVCERFQADVSNKLSRLIDGNMDLILGFNMTAMEMSEGVMAMHSEGILNGIWAISCFRLDHYGHVFVDINEVLAMGRKVRKIIASNKSSMNRDCFLAPELFPVLKDKRMVQKSGDSIGFSSDVWSLGCLFVKLLMGEGFRERIDEFLLLPPTDGNGEVPFDLYGIWMEKLELRLTTIMGTEFKWLNQIIIQSLDYMPGNRPNMSDLWREIGGVLTQPCGNYMGSPDSSVAVEKSVCYVILSNLCVLPTKSAHRSEEQKNEQILHDHSSKTMVESSTQNANDLINGLCESKFKSVTMEGHRDCITELTIGGGFLVSSSFDKTINVWSLLDFSLIKSLKGHEHRVMAVLFVDTEVPCCISGDSGGLIFVWDIGSSHLEPVKKWNEHNDWRFSGIHAMTVSGTEFLFTGSGDKSIKAWSLKDYTLTSTMIGHKSVVSCLAVSHGVLYSGSWDGTIRLWWLSDHTPLAVLGEDSIGNITSVLSISVNLDILIASHENGCIKMWKNNMLVRSTKPHESAIFSVATFDKWLFMGGWNKRIDVQVVVSNEYEIDTELLGTIPCDGIVTAMVYWQGKLIVGFANKLIKVYYYDTGKPGRENTELS